MQATTNQQRNSFFLILLLGLLETLTPFSIDMYLPAFPRIAQDLHSNIENVSLSVSSYFLGFAIGQILYGPLLDRYGRKKPLYIGLSVYIAATVACTLSRSVEVLLAVRFIQALGGCVGSVAALTLVQDLFPPERRASIISFLILTIGLSPMLAPSAGSLILGIWGWAAIFYTLAAIACLLLVAAFFFLPSGAPPDRNISLLPRPILTVFRRILTQPQFYVYTLSSSFAFSGLFIYVAGSPALFMDYFGLSSQQYGGVFAALSVGLIGGSQLNHILTKRFRSDVLYTFSLVLNIVFAFIFLITVALGILPLAGHLVLLFFILLCLGVQGPNATAVSMAPFTSNAGSASSLLGFIRIGIGGVISSAVGLFHYPGSLPLAASIAAASLVAGFILWWGGKTVHKKTDLFSQEFS